ncbi:hypothetical protein [Paenibacillus alba]|uniref:Uncharacterized protein n=1 Tax=Paenibacillus alba TaxID=1197127 RepID=A0ABU6GGU0_9BACL|nr:hypothetical protein [Paenibacillus alba]MEC0232422.1 hypothetical protein [Paenibacillus alba]
MMLAENLQKCRHFQRNRLKKRKACDCAGIFKFFFLYSRKGRKKMHNRRNLPISAFSSEKKMHNRRFLKVQTDMSAAVRTCCQDFSLEMRRSSSFFGLWNNPIWHPPSRGEIKMANGQIKVATRAESKMANRRNQDGSRAESRWHTGEIVMAHRRNRDGTGA